MICCWLKLRVMRRSGLNRVVLLLSFLLFLFSTLKAQDVLQEVKMEKLNALSYRVRYKLGESDKLSSASVILKIYRRREGEVTEIFSKTITPPGLRAGVNYSYSWQAGSQQVKNGDELQAKILLSYLPVVQTPVRSIPYINIPPKANSGPFQEVFLPATAGIWLDGSHSVDSDGRITSYHWRQIGGPSTVRILHPDSARTQIAGNMLEGRYAFELTVKDNTGHSASDRTVITIKPAPVTVAPAPPVIPRVTESKSPATVSAKPLPPLKGGPGNALINILVPGLGHYLVSGDAYGKKRKPASFLVTAAYAGSLGGAFYFRSKFNQQYGDYKELANYREYQYDDQGNIIGVRGADAGKASQQLDKANTYRRNALICLGAGGTILVADLVYTYIKGKKNQSQWEKDNRISQLIISSDGTGITAGIRIKF
jgi:hypothetical protein